MGRNNTHKKTAKATLKSCTLVVGVLLGMSAFKSRSSNKLNDLVDGLKTGLGSEGKYSAHLDSISQCKWMG